MNAGLGSSEGGRVEGVGTWLSDRYSSTRTFGSVTAQVGVVVFSFGEDRWLQRIRLGAPVFKSRVK